MSDELSFGEFDWDSFDVSPDGTQFPVEFLVGLFRDSSSKTEKAIGDIYNYLVKEGAVTAQVAASLDSGVRYVVDTSEEMLHGLESGALRFTQEKGGQMFAQLREENGLYGQKVPIRREEFGEAFDPVMMAMALQMRTLQSQIENMQEDIKEIDENVKEVLLGQQNDRLARYHGGLSLFLEAKETIDGELRKTLIGQSLCMLSEGVSQLTLQMQSDIEWLRDGKYKELKGKSEKHVLERVSKIDQTFECIHQSSLLKAGIYGYQGEYASMARALESYGRFLESTVARNAVFLAECDSSEDGAERYAWKKRASLSLEIGEIAKQLSRPAETFYFAFREGDRDGEVED